MSAVIDTHTVIWHLSGDARLSATASDAIAAAASAGLPLFVPSICLVEMTYVSERGRISQRAIDRLHGALDEPRSDIRLAPLTLLVADAVAGVSRAEVPDMPDRIIAATALALDLPLITRDGRIRASSVRTIW